MNPLRRRVLLTTPLALAAVAGGGSWLVLERLRQGQQERPVIPSPLTGKAVPSFAFPGLSPGGGFGTADIAAQGRPLLLNFFASWCFPCAQEMSVLLRLKDRGTHIWGVAFKDKAQDAAGFLRRNGDPYARVALDALGRAEAIFELAGVPQTYLVDGHGVLRWGWAGALHQDVVTGSLLPALRAG